MEGPEYLGWLEDSPERDYPVLMGATTYRVMHDLVKGGEPGTESMDAMPRFVFSSLIESADWANTTLVKTDAVDAVRELKQSSELPLRTHGSVSLCRSLVTAGLVRAQPGRQALHLRYRVRQGLTARRRGAGHITP